MDLSIKEVHTLSKMQPVTLTTAVTGNGSASAIMSNNIIEVKITTVTDAARAYATIETPVPFRIVGVHVIGATVTASKELELGIRNDDAVIVTNIGIGTDNLIKWAQLYAFARTNAIFGAGDNDLVVTLSGTSIGTAIAVLHILPM